MIMDSRPQPLNVIKGIDQGLKGINRGVVPMMVDKLVQPTPGNSPLSRHHYLSLGGGAGADALLDALGVIAQVHTKNSSTDVLGGQYHNASHFGHANHMDRRNKNTRKILANNVKRLRMARGMNQMDLGKRAGLGQTTISSIEHPEGKSPSLETIASLANALEIPEWALLLDDDHPDAHKFSEIGHLVNTYTRLPEEGREQVTRVAEAESRYSKSE